MALRVRPILTASTDIGIEAVRGILDVADHAPLVSNSTIKHPCFSICPSQLEFLVAEPETWWGHSEQSTRSSDSSLELLCRTVRHGISTGD